MADDPSAAERASGGRHEGARAALGALDAHAERAAATAPAATTVDDAGTAAPAIAAYGAGGVTAAAADIDSDGGELDGGGSEGALASSRSRYGGSYDGMFAELKEAEEIVLGEGNTRAGELLVPRIEQMETYLGILPPVSSTAAERVSAIAACIEDDL